MDKSDAVTGACQCGAIRYRLKGEPLMYYACHCSDCRRQSASAFGLSLIVPAAALEFSAGRERLRFWDTRGEDGMLKRCAFCPDCGTRLFHTGEDPAEPISIKAGTLDDPARWTPLAHIWTRSALPWVRIDPDRFLCYEGEPDNDALMARWAALAHDSRLGA